jgi:small subunit ribosomal protein S13e
MGRMYGNGKGMSGSALPYKRKPATWIKMKSDDLVEQICKFAKKGMTPSQIGVTLRDCMGIPQVKAVSGNKIRGLAPDVPEDLYHLIKKAVSMRKHLEKSRKDKDSKFHLILVESRIHRLARYYRKTKQLPAVWKYQSANAAAIVS